MFIKCTSLWHSTRLADTTIEMSGATQSIMAAPVHNLPSHLGDLLDRQHRVKPRVRKARKNKRSWVPYRGFLRARVQGKKKMQGKKRMQGRKSRPSIFQTLPREIIVLVMCHTRSPDLANLIQADKSTNEIFKNHKISIFKRMQICQFPEFSGWFGDLPGFDGSTLGNNRTSEQVQRLRDVVFTFEWRSQVAAPSNYKAAGLVLHLLERYGGWRYLYYLYALKCHVEGEAQNLYRISHMTIPSMNKGLAKAMLLCFSIMSWRESTVGGEVEELADMPARVGKRLKIFQQEPPTLQDSMRTTLRFLIYRMSGRLQLAKIASYYWQDAPPVQTDEALLNLISEIMTKLLLECIFYFGVGNTVQLCEKSAKYDLMIARSWIQGRFGQDLRQLLNAIGLGIDQGIDPCIQEGSLWAAGIGFPTLGWVVTDEPSVKDIIQAIDALHVC